MPSAPRVTRDARTIAVTVLALALAATAAAGMPAVTAEEPVPPPGGNGTAGVVPPPALDAPRQETAQTSAPAPPGWVDPTAPDVLLGQVPGAPAPGEPVPDTSGAPAMADGGGGTKPDREEIRRSQADAAPPTRPGYVDQYTRLWQAIESGLARVQRLKARVADGTVVMAAASSDAGLAMRVRNRADFAMSEAVSQLDTAAKDVYIHGSTDLDIVVSVLGSEPDQLLRTIDSIVYLKSASRDELREFRDTRSAAVVAESGAALTLQSLGRARSDLEKAESALSRARSSLADDRRELDELIAAAAPQTVVGPGGCPTAVLDGTVPAGVDIRELCRRAVRGASTPQAAYAVKWALVRLGAPYACDGVGRLAPWRYDCSSYVSRAYAEGAGLQTAADGWAPSTRTMLPWDGAELDPHYARIEPDRIRPGDLVLYDTCPAGEVCPYRHVVMYLGALEPGGPEYMAHTNECGGVAHVAPFWGTTASNVLGVRRVLPAAGEWVTAPRGALDPRAEARTRG